MLSWGSERMGMVLGGSLFCLRLLVIVNSVYLLLRSLDLITEMPDMQITEAMFLISLFHLFLGQRGTGRRQNQLSALMGEKNAV